MFQLITLKYAVINMFYISLMVTTKQKLITDTQNIKRKKSKLLLGKILKSQRKTARKEERNKAITKQPENN